VLDLLACVGGTVDSGYINILVGLSIECQDQIGDHLDQFKVTDAR